MNNQELENRVIPPFLQSEDSEPQRVESPSVIETDDHRTFGIMKDEGRSLALKIIFKNGFIGVFPYSRISAPIFYDGNQEITVPVVNGRLQIIGENIEPLLDYLGHQKLVWIKEAMREDKMLTEAGETLINTIIYKSSGG